MTEDESQAAAEDLAKRLRLLMDVAVAESGTEPTYSQIADYLHERGTNLSRSRWTYMVNGHRYVQDPAVFEGLAEFFDVDAAFLLGEDGAATPEKVSAQLDLVRSMRAAKVKSYAARTLGDPRQFWRIADANDALQPADLLKTHKRLRIPAVRLPEP